MFVPAMGVQLIVTIKTYSAKAALRMAFETTLIYSSRIVISKLLMLPKLLLREQLMLMCEYLLVPCAEIAQDLVMSTLDVMVKVRPAPAGKVAALIWAVVAK